MKWFLLVPPPFPHPTSPTQVLTFFLVFCKVLFTILYTPVSSHPKVLGSVRTCSEPGFCRMRLENLSMESTANLHTAPSVPYMSSVCVRVKPLILQFYSIFQLAEYRCRAISFQGSFPNFLVLSGLRQVRSLWLLFASVPPWHGFPPQTWRSWRHGSPLFHINRALFPVRFPLWPPEH